MKYTFSPGEDIPAESFQTLDPDNPVAQTPAKLIGGTDVTLSSFTTLGAGSNDGAFKVTIDGVEYDNVGIDLSSTGISISQEIGEETGVNYSRTYGASSYRQGQSFFWEGGILAKIDLTLRKVGTPTGGYTLNLYEADENDFPTGSVIKSVSKLSQDLTTSYADYSFDFNVLLVGNKKYVLVLSYTGGSTSHYVQWAYTDSNVYSGGISIRSTNGGSNWYTNDTGDKRFIIYGISSEDDIATAVQTAIRTETSKEETVVWDTDHFEITSSTAGKTTSSILKLTAPTTGTDISGAGYLDLGANATEVAGDGEDYKLVRLDKDGKIPIETLSPIRAIASDTLRASADTERSKGGTDAPTDTPTKYKEISIEYGGMIRVKFDGKGNNHSGDEYAQVYKNGVPHGTLRDVSSSTYTTFSEDLLFEKGDLIQLYIWTTFNNSSYRAYAKNFRVCFDLQIGIFPEGDDVARTNLD